MGSLAWKIAVPSIVINLILGFLWLEVREDLAAEKVQCNADKLSAIAEAQRLAQEATEKNYEARLAELARQRDAEARAREAAEYDRLLFEQGQEEQAKVIRRLTLEASIDDIPDSKECLNVFVPCGALSGVLYAESGGEAGTGGGGENGVCADPSGSFADRDAFSNITYGDAMTLWGKDRGSLMTVNSRIEQIKVLSDETE